MEENIISNNIKFDTINLENGKDVKDDVIMSTENNIKEQYNIILKASIMDLDADCIAYLFLFLEPKLAIRLWMVCRWNSYGITPEHKVWKGVVKNLLGNERLKDIDDIYSRLNIIYSSDNGQPCPIDNISFMKELYRHRKCGRSGCYKIYREVDNYKDSCCYHPGTKRSTKLSCCKAKSFKDVGCKYSYHNGHFFNVLYSARPKDEIEKEKETEKKKDKGKEKEKEKNLNIAGNGDGCQASEDSHLPKIFSSISISPPPVKVTQTNNNTEASSVSSSLSSLPPIQYPNHFQQVNNN